MGKTLHLAILICLALGLPLASHAQQRPGFPHPDHALAGEALVKALREGGLTLLFRHAVTDWTQFDKMPMDPADCASQRNLSEGGRAQARLIGEGLAALRVPVGEVIASPICRTMETARLIAGRATPDNAVIGFDPAVKDAKGDMEPLRRIVRNAPPAGAVRLIAGHNSSFESVVGPPTLEEGEGAVLRVVNGEPVVVARLNPQDWKQLAATGERSAAVDPGFALEGAALVKALREGAHTLYFRHTATDFSQADRPTFAPTDCASQRNLSEAGRAQARAIGAALSALGVRVGEVIASPYCRTMETARLVGGKEPVPDEAVRGRSSLTGGAPDYRGLAELLSKRVKKGEALRIVAGHGNGFRAIAGVPHLEEGEAVVLRPGVAYWIVVSRIRVQDWPKLVEAARAAAR